METEIHKLSLDTFKNIPKLELHAHLNGSISSNTFLKLRNLKKDKAHNMDSLDFIDQDFFATNSLSECFQLFPMIHRQMDTPEAIYMATCDVIKDFYGDGVYYLELRTTPKAAGNSVTQDSYVETVRRAIDSTVAELNEKISVKLVLSVDRSKPLSCAEETVKIAEKYFISSQSIVGIDLSGNPNAGNMNEFIPLLEHAKRIGLKLTIHIAEVHQRNEEVKKVLNLQPHRLGHGTFLHQNVGGCIENFNTLKELKIPLEICLTSNVICKTVSAYEDHHFQYFREMNYPCTLCTDDKGIFKTCLSNEYYLASQYYDLTEADLYDLSYNSIDYIFSSNSEKEELKKLWKLKRLNSYIPEFATETT